MFALFNWCLLEWFYQGLTQRWRGWYSRTPLYTRLIRTPGYYGQFHLSRRKAHIFSLKLTRLIRTPVNTDNGHFSVSRVTNSHTVSTPLYGHYLRSIYFRRQNCDNCRNCALLKWWKISTPLLLKSRSKTERDMFEQSVVFSMLAPFCPHKSFTSFFLRRRLIRTPG